jgi:hypothetical protein
MLLMLLLLPLFRDQISILDIGRILERTQCLIMKQLAILFHFTKHRLLRLSAVLTATANLERFLQFITCLAGMILP